jgi:hypothetical protein
VASLYTERCESDSVVRFKDSASTQMISEKQLPELRTYRKLEGTMPVEMAPSFERLVVSGVNERLPVHRWFRFKEGFSADLLRALLSSLELSGRKELRILDPFCGVGTTLICAQELSQTTRVTALGIERNPFIRFVAQTKVRWPDMDPDRIMETGQEILTASYSSEVEIPKLSSLTTGRCMSRHIARRLLSIRDAIQSRGSSPHNDALMLGVAASVEQLSKVRKDGRALRLVTKNRQFTNSVLLEKWREIASDVRFLQEMVPNAAIPTVILGDGRSIASHNIGESSFDLILTSPPYPNNIDYSEVYKLELWLLGFVSDQKEFLELRRSTFRSHPTVLLPQLPDDFKALISKGGLRDVLGPILRRTQSSSEHYRHRVVLGYVLDLWTALLQQFRCLRKNGVAVFVVGNSLHGGKHLPYLIPTDLLVSLLGRAVGFRVDRLAIARNFRRRLSGNHFLRESVVVLRKE